MGNVIIRENKGRQFGRSMLWYWISYFAVTLIGFAHTFFNVLVLHMGSMAQGPGLGEGYEATKPWHPLYNIIIFTVFGLVFMKGLVQPTFRKALTTGILWSVISIVFDLVGWVLIPHPLQLTFKQFYVEYQPWITLVYLAMIAGPVLGYMILKITGKGVKKSPECKSDKALAG
jgi:hypothetical protein